MTIFIHSDDMGATKHVTQRLLESWRADVITGFSVLANGEACNDMTRALVNEPSRPARIACHLNLSEGLSTIPAHRVPLLIDRQGMLNHTFGSLIKMWIFNRQELKRQIEIEWRAQIELVKQQIGPRPIAALDSHMHVHMLPFLFPITAKLAEEYNIPQIRISHEPLFAASCKDLGKKFYAINLVKNIVLRFCALRAVPVAKLHKLQGPSRVVGILYSGHMTAAAALKGLKAATRTGNGDTEIIFHIGRSLDEEKDRWKSRPFIEEFYRSSLRDIEHDEAAIFVNELHAGSL